MIAPLARRLWDTALAAAFLACFARPLAWATAGALIVVGAGLIASLPPRE